MAHTMGHPFSGSDITSCSYGAQSVAKATTHVTPKYKGKPMSQMDLSTMWIKDFAKQVDGPVLRASKKIGDDTHITLFTKKEGKLHVEYLKNGKPNGDFVYSGNTTEAGKYLQGQAKQYHLNGWDSEWKYAADAADGLGVTEAGFEAANATGSWEAAVANVEKGLVKPGDILAQGKSASDGSEWRLIYKGNNELHVQVKMPNGEWLGIDKSKELIYKTYFEPGGQWSGDITWKFGKAKGEPPAVPGGSKSIGAMTDEDAATLFVQVKDDFAAARGINIKGVNKALDDAVFKKLAELTGYSPSELAAKVERYKANGNKLSALKKKTVGKGNKLDATKYAKQETIDTAVADLKAPGVADNLGVYTDEDVAKAYIKAKDHVASLESNNWTLYSADPAFEDAVRAYMKSEYGVDVNAVRLKKHLADYISSDGKLSVLKKKMVKAGEMEKKADTLKAGKFEKLSKADTAGDTQVSLGKTYKKDPGAPTAEQLADLGYTPPGAKVHTFTDPELVDLYREVKPGLYLSSSPEAIYEKMLKYQAKLHAQGKDVSLLDIVRAFDREAAHSFLTENKFLYEKKLADWASSPVGRRYIKDKIDKEAFLRNQPDLPPDSTLFNIISTRRAQEIQNDMGHWTAAERQGIYRYTDYHYTDINDSLRGGRWPSGANADATEQTWRAMKPSTEDMLLHRGSTGKSFGLPSNATAADIAKFTGETVIEKGFSSTSVAGRAAFGHKPVLLEIEAPKGTLMTYVDSISANRGENEMLLPPNTHFKVLRVREEGHQIVVRMRVVKTSKFSGRH